MCVIAPTYVLGVMYQVSDANVYGRISLFHRFSRYEHMVLWSKALPVQSGVRCKRFDKGLQAIPLTCIDFSFIAAATSYSLDAVPSTYPGLSSMSLVISHIRINIWLASVAALSLLIANALVLVVISSCCLMDLICKFMHFKCILTIWDKFDVFLPTVHKWWCQHCSKKYRIWLRTKQRDHNVAYNVAYCRNTLQCDKIVTNLWKSPNRLESFSNFAEWARSSRRMGSNVRRMGSNDVQKKPRRMGSRT